MTTEAAVTIAILGVICFVLLICCLGEGGTKKDLTRQIYLLKEENRILTNGMLACAIQPERSVQHVKSTNKMLQQVRGNFIPFPETYEVEG